MLASRCVQRSLKRVSQPVVEITNGSLCQGTLNKRPLFPFLLLGPKLSAEMPHERVKTVLCLETGRRLQASLGTLSAQ